MTDRDRTGSYQAFLEEKHKKFQTPDAVLQDVFQKALGFPFDEKRRIVKGEVNEVYDLRMGQKDHFIMRLSRADDWLPYDGESWVLKKCRQLGLPVPEVISIKHIEADGKPLHICIETKLPGIPLNELRDEEKIDHTSLKAILIQVGSILSQLHTIKTTGYDAIDINGKGYYKSFNEYMQKRKKKEARLLKAADLFNFDRSQIHRALKIIQRYNDFFPTFKPVLNHNDLSPKHVLVDNDQVTGIIDFETSISGHPIQDFARWNYYHDDYPLGWIQEGYSNKALFNKDFKRKLHFMRIFYGLGAIEWYSYDNHPGIATAKRNLQQDLEYFKDQ